MWKIQLCARMRKVAHSRNLILRRSSGGATMRGGVLTSQHLDDNGAATQHASSRETLLNSTLHLGKELADDR